jgi:hypothetical protein
MMAQALRLPDLRPISIRMAMIKIATQEDLADPLALVTRSMKALLFGEPNQRVSCSDTKDSRRFTGPQPIREEYQSLAPDV